MKPFTLKWWMHVQSNVIQKAFYASWDVLMDCEKDKRKEDYERLHKIAHYIGLRIIREYER